MIIALHMAMDSSQQTKIDDSPRFLTFNQTSFHLGQLKKKAHSRKNAIIKKSYFECTFIIHRIISREQNSPH